MKNHSSVCVSTKTYIDTSTRRVYFVFFFSSFRNRFKFNREVGKAINRLEVDLEDFKNLSITNIFTSFNFKMFGAHTNLCAIFSNLNKFGSFFLKCRSKLKFAIVKFTAHTLPNCTFLGIEIYRGNKYLETKMTEASNFCLQFKKKQLYSIFYRVLHTRIYMIFYVDIV